MDDFCTHVITTTGSRAGAAKLASGAARPARFYTVPRTIPGLAPEQPSAGAQAPVSVMP